MIQLDFQAVLVDWPLLLRGAAFTLGLTAVATLLGVALGVACARARTHAGVNVVPLTITGLTTVTYDNTGATQEEYDSIHGVGAFAQLPVPTLKERRKDFDAYLPKTSKHPNASGVFRSVPEAGKSSSHRPGP